MYQTYFNIAKNSLKRKNFLVMAAKVLTRIQEMSGGKDRHNVGQWCQHHTECYMEYLKSIDPALWQETQEVCSKLERQALQTLQAIDIDLGGAGNYHLLYFLTRHLSARTIVETGVAAGWSSLAILTAINKNNNQGHLYSSDFPYFRQKTPEELSGYVVPDHLKGNWTLLLDGDSNNLPMLIKKIQTVDIFHYDSDKSYKGRRSAYEMIIKKCHDKTVFIFDDIQDNAHFKDFVEHKKCAFKVFEFNNKYVGLIGDL